MRGSASRSISSFWRSRESCDGRKSGYQRMLRIRRNGCRECATRWCESTLCSARAAGAQIKRASSASSFGVRVTKWPVPRVIILKRYGKPRWRLRWGNCNPEVKVWGKAIAVNGITEGSYGVTIFHGTRLWAWLSGHYRRCGTRRNALFPAPYFLALLSRPTF